MNLLKEERNQWLLIALVSACLLLLGVAVWLQGNDLKALSYRLERVEQDLNTTPRVVETEQENSAWNNSCTADGLGVSLGLCFDYPKNWFLGSYVEITPTALVITSSPGLLLSAESTGGPGMTGQRYFEKGYEIKIFPVNFTNPGYFGTEIGSADHDIGSKLPNHSSLYLPLQACEDAGCPNERYFYRLVGSDAYYQIDVHYQDVPMEEVRLNIDHILQSMVAR